MPDSHRRPIRGWEVRVYAPYTEREIAQLVNDLERKYALRMDRGPDGESREAQTLVEVRYITLRRGARATADRAMPDWREFVAHCEREAGDRFLVRHLGHVNSIVSKRFPGLSRSGSEGIVGEQWMVAVNRFEAERGAGLFNYWILLASRRCADTMEREALRPAKEQAAPRDPKWTDTVITDVDLRRADLGERMAEALQGHDRQARRLLMKGEGFLDREIAGLEGVGANTIPGDLSRARADVRRHCAQFGYLVGTVDHLQDDDEILGAAAEAHLIFYRASEDRRER